jgi:hypothetical protein
MDDEAATIPEALAPSTNVEQTHDIPKLAMWARIENSLVILLLLLACSAGLAWLRTYDHGYQRTWSDPRQQSCGRFVSLRGHILWQRCDLTPFPPLPESMLKWRILMPPDFAVGSNPGGARVVINCRGMAVPFAFPNPARFIGWETRSGSSTDGANQTRWSAKWNEDTISYLLLVILLILFPAAVGVRRLLKRTKPEREAYTKCAT